MQWLIVPLRHHHERYESWFERHDTAYLSELVAVRALLPWTGRGAPAWAQTLCKPLAQIREIEPMRAGRGDGSFVVVKASLP